MLFTFDKNLNFKLMDTTVNDYIEGTLNKIAILDAYNVGFENIAIFSFNKHHDNGDLFQNQKNENYAIAILNAITEESAKQITRELKKNKRINVQALAKIVDSHRLKCYIEDTSSSYEKWKTGDIGVVTLEFDDSKKIVTPRFINETHK